MLKTSLAALSLFAATAIAQTTTPTHPNTPTTQLTTQPTTQPAEPGEPVPYEQNIEPATAELTPERTAMLLDSAAKSVVIVRYVWESEDGRRELEGLGLVINEEGLTISPLDLVPPLLPDSQVTEFQLVIPNREGDAIEIDAVLAGRDERSGLVFIRPADDAEMETQVEWTPVKLASAEFVVGQPLVSVGRLPDAAGYTPFVRLSRVSAEIRGPSPTVLVDGGLTGVGSVVMDTEGRAVGLVDRTGQRSPFLTGMDFESAVDDTPSLFVPVWYLEPSLDAPPINGDPALPYLGLARMTGLTQELREYYGLGDRPAIQVGDMLDASPAMQAGIEEGDVLVALNGEALERGDTDDEVPAILNRTIARMAIGDVVTLTLLDPARNEREVEITLIERPKAIRAAQRFHGEDLGFSVREMLMQDTYARKLPAAAPGVVVAYVRDQSAAAAAGIQINDVIRQINQTPVEGLSDFQAAYDAAREQAPDEAVVLEVLRGPETQVIRIEAPR